MARENPIEQYITEQNAAAPVLRLARSVGLGASEVISSVRIRAFEYVTDTLSRNGLGDLARTGLAGLLVADIAPLLKKDEAAQSLSMIDLKTLGLTNNDDIKRFIRSHGIDLNKPEDIQEAIRIMNEAVRFYDDDIAEFNQEPKINRKLRKFSSATDIINIFKIASGRCEFKHLIPQACALLRIAVAIQFKESNPLIPMIPAVEKKLKEFEKKYIKEVGPNKKTFVAGPMDEEEITLVHYMMRIKSKERVLMKLLHKPSNHASEVVDHIGARYVTRSAGDTLKLIYKMFFDPKTAFLPAMNIRIGRSIQKLVDQKMIQDALANPRSATTLFTQLSEETSDCQELSNGDCGKQNIFSSNKYRAIHITFDLPVDANGDGTKHFPVEFQFTDKNSWIANTNGEASHDHYVELQRLSVTERLLSNNLLTGYEESRKK